MRKENSIAVDDNTQVCVMRGFYDEEGEYREAYYNDIPLSDLPEKAVSRIAFEYDLSILYSECEVLVVAKNMQDINEHQKLEGTPQFFHGLLHHISCRGYDGYMCIAVNLEALRRGRKQSRSK